MMCIFTFSLCKRGEMTILYIVNAYKYENTVSLERSLLKIRKILFHWLCEMLKLSKSVHIILWNPGQNRKPIAFWFKLADFEIQYSVIQGKFKFITFHSVSSAYINCHRVNANAIFQFSLHHLNSFSFMFVATDSWNTDFIFWNASSLKFSFEKFQMRKV